MRAPECQGRKAQIPKAAHALGSSEARGSATCGRGVAELMPSRVARVSVRYVRPQAQDEERLRATCAELQALAILRLAGQDAGHAEAVNGPDEQLLKAPRNPASDALTSATPQALMCDGGPR